VRVVGWESQATGRDPIGLTSADLSGFGSRYKPFFMTELSGGSFSPLGGIGLDITYLTATGLTRLLDVNWILRESV
jgi:hypothetical protein